VILLHDINPAASSAEWDNLVDAIAKDHRVYVLDLLGCGRSDKPELTYTNFYFVELLIDFIKSRVCEKSFIVASGLTCSIALMAGVYDSTKFSGMVFINPPSTGLLSLIPDNRTKIAKKILEAPIVGKLVYNKLYSRQRIDNLFTEKYLYNPFKVTTSLIDTYYESAHLSNGSGRFLQGSLSGRYINMNVNHALKNLKIHADIIVGGALRDEDFISRTWRKINPKIKIYSVAKSKILPHFEQPEETLAFILKSMEESRAMNAKE
jgi:pimeloyl-ACP methyl ester carboxylesterase